ncbi:hypothetical protein V6Z05_19930 [Leptospira venezuelensis]|uniref:hypothetical protein n=1 Tax=Leptospira venezuelensis TaxID=1958811 RepID=UPI0012FF92AE|nr:hypothetical protein [Leptospira venezuelensis]
MKKLIAVSFLITSCVSMSETIGYIELSEAKYLNEHVEKKEFEHCGRYPTIIGDSLEKFRKSTGKTKIENLEIVLSHRRSLVPCVLIYYVEKEKS